VEKGGKRFRDVGADTIRPNHNPPANRDGAQERADSIRPYKEAKPTMNRFKFRAWTEEGEMIYSGDNATENNGAMDASFIFDEWDGVTVSYYGGAKGSTGRMNIPSCSARA
jgi:hypothetical protein